MRVTNKLSRARSPPLSRNLKVNPLRPFKPVYSPRSALYSFKTGDEQNWLVN